MKYDRSFFDAGIPRRGSRSVKWDAASFCGPDDLPMWVADWDFRCAEPIVEALKQRAEHACYGYSYPDPNDQEAFCGYWLRRHQLAIRPEQTCMLPCVVTGLRQAVLTFTAPGDSVLIMTPVYGPFRDAVLRSGRIAAAAAMRREADGRYCLDFDAIEDHLKQGVKLILFCNPHNPVSRAWSREELSRLVQLALSYHAVLISDEIHADFVYSPLTFHPMLSIPGADACTVMLAAASKTFNIPGLQQAMCVSFNKALLKALSDQIEMQGITSGNVFALPATQAAYTLCDDWLDGMIAYLEESRSILSREIARRLPQARLTPIDATALCWIDLSAYAPTCEQLDKKLRVAHLVLNRGTDFGAPDGEGFMRLNFACPHSSLSEGLNRLEAAMKK